MTTAQWDDLSTNAFWIAFSAYLISGVLYFYFLLFKQTRVWRIASALAWVGLAANVVAVVGRGFAAQRVPWGNMYEFSMVLSLLAVLGYLVIAELRFKVRSIGGFVMLFAVVTMGVASAFLYARPGPLVPALDSGWLKIHVFTIMVAAALLSLGSGVFTPLYLWKARRERKQASLPAPVMGGAVDELPPHFVAGADEPASTGGDDGGDGIPADPRKRSLLPSAETLDRLAYRTIAVGFPIWTAAVIFGAIWAEKAWGRYWGWDPKEVWAFITWVIFAAYLHARATAGWKGRRAAVVALAGFCAFLIGYYVVNTVIPGLHSYSGV